MGVCIRARDFGTLSDLLCDVWAGLSYGSHKEEMTYTRTRIIV